MAPYRNASKKDDCCGVHFLKYVLFIFNFIFFLAGCAVLGVGIWTIWDKHSFISLLVSPTYAATAYVLVAAGALVIIVTGLGCASIWQENRCCILLYTFLLLVVFLLEAVAGVIAYIYEEQVYTELQDSLNSTFVTSYKIDPARTAAIDELQIKFKCCGADGYQDWKESVWVKENPRMQNRVPDSCCKTPSNGCGVRDHPSNIYQDGCISSLANEIKEHLIILGAVGLGICLVQIFGMIFSCCLYIHLKDYEEIRY